MTSFRAAICLTAAVLSQTAPVQAQTIEITGDTTSGATWFRPGNPSEPLLYTTHLVTILNPATFSIYVPMAGLEDPYIFLYSGAFDPLDPLMNLVAADDDAGNDWVPGAGIWDALLTGTDGEVTVEGDYTLVVTGFCCDQQGTYTVYLNGILVGWGLATAAQLDELRAMAAQSGRQGLRVLTGNIASALAEGQATRALSFSTKGGEPARDMFPVAPHVEQPVHRRPARPVDACPANRRRLDRGAGPCGRTVAFRGRSAHGQQRRQPERDTAGPSALSRLDTRQLARLGLGRSGPGRL